LVDIMRILKLEELAASIERRKVQLGISGYDYVMPNSGQYRSPEKRALLEVIDRGVSRTNDPDPGRRRPPPKNGKAP
jgi:hypothetical protein